MRIGILGAYRTLDKLISYIPQANHAKRQMKISRSDSVLDQSKAKPLVMCDTEFWNDSVYPDFIEAIIAAKSRDWSTAYDAGKKIQQGSKGISKATWSALRGKAYESAEMIGAMLACLTYDADNTVFKDYVVSAAPNLLYDKNGKKYIVHSNEGDNAGGQVHSEVLMGSQLLALITAMKAAQETPRGSQASRTGLSGGTLTIDVDLFIEKKEMCGGCRGMWDRELDKATYRIV